MRFRKRLIFLIVVAVSAKEVHNFIPVRIAMAGSVPLAKDDSWDAMEVGSMRSMFDPGPAQEPFGWADDLHLLRNFGLPPERKEPLPLTAGLTSRRPTPEREIAAAVPGGWNFNIPAGFGWTGGNGGVQRYVTNGGGPVPVVVTPGIDLPPADGGPTAPPPISGAPFPRSGFGGLPDEDFPDFVGIPAPGSIPNPVPEPTALSLIVCAALALRRRH